MGYLALHNSRAWSSRKMRKARLCPRAEQTGRGEYEYSLTKFSLSCDIRADEGKVWGEKSVSVRRGRTLGDSDMIPCSML